MVGSDFIAHVAFAGVAAVGGFFFAIGGLFFLMLGAFELVIGIGLLNLANWARILTIVCAAIGLAAASLGVLGALVHFLPVLMMRRAITARELTRSSSGISRNRT